MITGDLCTVFKHYCHLAKYQKAYRYSVAVFLITILYCFILNITSTLVHGLTVEKCVAVLYLCDLSSRINYDL